MKRFAEEYAQVVRLVLATTFLAVMINSCKKDKIVDPPPPKDPRTYTWTVDTLAYPGSLQTIMTDIWASAPNDVYVGGHNERGFGKLYHFDGNSWSPVQLTPNEDIYGIYGFGKNDVWAVGSRLDYNPSPPPTFIDSSLAFRFNGSAWSRMRLPYGRQLHSVWGSSPTDVWMGGWSATLYHYDGTSVRKDSLPITVPSDYQIIYSVHSITGRSKDELYLLLVAPTEQFTERYYIFKRQSNLWVISDSVVGYARNSLWMSKSGNLYASGFGVHKKQNGFWRQIFPETNLGAIGIHGTGDDNFFVVGYSGFNDISGEVFQFNGTDWFHFTQLRLQYVTYRAVWVMENDVFIVGIAGGQNNASITLILHGH